MSQEIARNESFLRQMDVADPAKFRWPVTILGVGAAGSASGIGLGKMGIPKLVLIDFDYFEVHNVPSQLCLEEAHLGMKKVEAMKDLILKMSPKGLQIAAYPMKLGLPFPLGQGRWSCTYCHGAGLVGTDGTACECVRNESLREGLKNQEMEMKYDLRALMGWETENVRLLDLENPVPSLDPRQVIEGILVSCPDCMDARRHAWEIAKYNPKIPYVIDVRMSIQYIRIHIASTMTSEGVKRYQETLIPNDRTVEDPCGARSIIFTSMIAGAQVANFVKKLSLSETVPEEWRMDVHSGAITQVYNGKEVSSNEDLALAMLKE